MKSSTTTDFSPFSTLSLGRLQARRERLASRRPRWLWRERLPVDAGEISLLLVVASVTLHVWVGVLGPDAQGHLFRAGILAEAYGQAFLLTAPLLGVYAGFRTVLRNPAALSAYLAIVGGTFIGGITTIACLVLALGGTTA